MLKPQFTPVTALGLASLLLLGGALLGEGEAQARLIRERSEHAAAEQLARAGFPWARLVIDDAVGRLEGQAPSDAERQRALTTARELLAPAMGWPGVFARLDSAISVPASSPSAATPTATSAAGPDCAIRLAAALGEDTVLFESGSSALTPASQALLQRLAPVARACGAGALAVQGHTDRQGQPELNQRLSLRRAQAVVDALSAAGMPAEQLRAEGLGASRPLVDGDSAQANALNRRIEFKWVQRDSAAG